MHSGTPEKGNLIKHIHEDATASYNNVKNYALHIKRDYMHNLKDLLYTLQPVSTVIGALLKEKIMFEAICNSWWV